LWAWLFALPDGNDVRPADVHPVPAGRTAEVVRV
jgi:hypothetical protein